MGWGGGHQRGDVCRICGQRSGPRGELEPVVIGPHHVIAAHRVCAPTFLPCVATTRQGGDVGSPKPDWGQRRATGLVAPPHGPP